MTAPSPTPPPPPPTTTAPPVPSTPPVTTATIIVPAPTPAPANAPFFSGGDYVTGIVGLVAAVIAMLAWRAAVRSAVAAERAAKANEDMVTRQDEANRLHRDELAMVREHRAEDQTAVEDAAEDKARMVVRELLRNAGIDVQITNHSGAPITKLRLVHVSKEPAHWRSGLNPNISHNPVEKDILPAGASHTFHVVFWDEDGTMQRYAGDSHAVVYRFTDTGNRRWEISDYASPMLVPVDDGDIEEE